MNDAKVNEVTGEATSAKGDRKQELLVFLLVTLVLFPLLAICIVGGYGLLVWIYQMIMGPPGPPAG